MVTVELAFASLGAAAALVVMAWVITVLMMLGECQDLATAVARQEARGDQAAVTKVLAARPTGSTVSIDRDGEEIAVTVELRAQPWADWIPPVPLKAVSTVIREPL